MIDSALGHFDETGTRVDKNSGGFMMPQTVNTPILISVPNVEMRAWNNAVFSRNSKGLPCMTLWASYWNYPDIQHAVCCAHLLRELTGIDENHPEQKWASAFIDLYWK